MKQTLFFLLLLVSTFQTTAQTNNILRGLVIIKGEDKKPLKGVSIQVVGISNKAFTDDNGFYELKCTGMSAGDVVSLIVSKDGYVILDKNALQEVPIRKDPNRRFDFVMQEEGKRKSDVDMAEKRIVANMNKQFDAQKSELETIRTTLDNKLQQTTLNEAERRFYQDSLVKVNIAAQKANQDRDKALQLARETAEKLTAFDTEGASKELKQAQTLFEAGKLDSAYTAINELTIQNKVKAAKRLQQKSDSLRNSAIQDYFYKGQLAIANGKFDEAERLYTEGVNLDSTNVDNLLKLANFLYSQNETLKAITYYERALSFSKTDDLIGTFCNNLGIAYKTVNKILESEKYYLKSLDIYTRLSKSNPQQFEPYLATTAMNLGNYYQTINKMPEAEKYYLQSLDIYARLAKSNPQQFEPYLASTANNLGEYYRVNNKMPESEKYYLQSLDIYARLAKSNPQRFEPALATTVMNLGNYYKTVNKMPEAEKYYLQSLDIYARLSKSNSQQFEPALARTAMNLGIYYFDINKMPESEKYYLQSLDIYARLAKSNPQQFEPALATTAMNLGNHYYAVNKMPEAEKYYLQSLDIYAQLSKSNPQQFEPSFGLTQINLGNYYKTVNKMPESEKYYLQSLDIYARLAKSNPQQFEPSFGLTQINLGLFYQDQKDYTKAEMYLTSALAIYEKWEKVVPAVFGKNRKHIWDNVKAFYEEWIAAVSTATEKTALEQKLKDLLKRE